MGAGGVTNVVAVQGRAGVVPVRKVEKSRGRLARPQDDSWGAQCVTFHNPRPRARPLRRMRMLNVDKIKEAMTWLCTHVPELERKAAAYDKLLRRFNPQQSAARFPIGKIGTRSSRCRKENEDDVLRV